MLIRKKNKFSIPAFILLVTSLFILFIASYNIFEPSNTKVNGIQVLIISIWALIYFFTAYISYGNLYLFSMTYVLPLIVFHFGLTAQHTLGIINVAILESNDGYWYGLATWYAILAISCIGIGLSLCFSNEHIDNENKAIYIDIKNNYLLKIRSLGRGLLWVSLLFLIITIIQNGNIFSKSRFELFYGGDTRSIGVFSMLCPTAVLAIMISAKKGKNLFISIIISGVIFILLLLSGYRSIALFPLIVGVVLWVKLGHKINSIVLTGAIFGILIIIPVIGQLRMLSYDAVELNDIARASETTGILNSFQEMGGSIGVLAVTLKNIPIKEDYRYGYTYWLYLPMLVPNVGLSMTQSYSRASMYEKMHKGEDITPELLPSDWATLKIIPQDFKKGAGTGFSAIGEPYMNFGYLGVVIYFILLGWLLGKLDSKIIGLHYNYLCFSVLYFWQYIPTVRNDLGVFLKPIFFTFLVLIIWKQARKISPFLDRF